MVNRSTNIKGRVLNKLKLYGISSSEITDEELYAELKSAQDIIISEVNFIKKISITIQTHADSYSIPKVASVKAAEIPESWRYEFNIIPNKEFIDKINSQYITVTQPIIGTIYDNQLRIYPKPTAEFNGDVLKLIVHLNSSEIKINENTEPVIPEYFDKAIELYAISQFLIGNPRAQLLNEFYQEIKRLRPIPHRASNNNLQRPRVL